MKKHTTTILCALCLASAAALTSCGDDDTDDERYTYAYNIGKMSEDVFNLYDIMLQITTPNGTSLTSITKDKMNVNGFQLLYERSAICGSVKARVVFVLKDTAQVNDSALYSLSALHAIAAGATGTVPASTVRPLLRETIHGYKLKRQYATHIVEIEQTATEQEKKHKQTRQ